MHAARRAAAARAPRRGRGSRGCRRPPRRAGARRAAAASASPSASASIGGTGRSKTSPETSTRSTSSLVGDRLDLVEHVGVTRPCGRAGRGACRRASPRCGGSSWGRRRAAVRGPRTGRPRRRVATSSFRVAHGGKGKVTTSGTGIAGWETTIVPGFSSRARARVDGSIQPYSARSASAASSRPLTRIAAFSSTSDATRLAVCWAPTSSTPSERPRWAMSISMSFSGPSALARRVLVQLVEHDHRERQALARLLLLARTSRSGARRRRSAAPGRAATGSRRR